MIITSAAQIYQENAAGVNSGSLKQKTRDINGTENKLVKITVVAEVFFARVYARI